MSVSFLLTTSDASFSPFIEEEEATGEKEVEEEEEAKLVLKS